MSRFSLRCCCAIVCFIALAAAFQPAAYAAQAGSKSQAIVMEQSSPEYSWTLQTPAKAGVVQVILSLRDAKGGPAKGKALSGVVWMPEMPMRGYPLELEFYELEPGEYGALVQYQHGGFWRIMAKFTEGGKIFHQAFDFNLED